MIAVVTDSTSDLPQLVVEKFGIRVVPAVLVLDGESYEDGTELTRDEFYRRLPELAEPPKTASPSTGRFEAVYRSLLERTRAGLQGLVLINPYLIEPNGEDPIRRMMDGWKRLKKLTVQRLMWCSAPGP